MTGVIVHEWLESVGGGERVVDALAAEFPDAPIICPWDDVEDRYGPGRVRESWLAATPLRNHKAAALPFLLPWWRSLPAMDADWLLIGTHLFAHHARLRGPSRDIPKYVYAYSPGRYIWEPDIDERGQSALVRAASVPLRSIDRKRAAEPVKVAAVSNFIAERIERCWDRESTVIYPPVDVAAFPGSDDELTEDELRELEALPAGFILGASRFVPYKRVDLAIAAGVAADLPVVIAGDGPERERLLELARRNPGRVTFVHRPSNAMLRALYRRAAVYVFGAVEDFGIMPVEAMAAGTPVVGNAIGGASETVVDGVTGALFRSTDAAELRRAVEVASAVDPAACRARAAEFDGSTFGGRIREWMA
ncbi:glycosyltransferase [Humibacter sp.]|jgi:glycosyltransferase involved in cell wall biosynthesis|uniref:glycosyltransferase n=1 Tax=Humibacter sp. TaxID=1940291 RepID=UPI002BFD6F00|nr:glycosyltransferase [Humibacter sp.]HVX09483.1 glycosyltransferase [Humibacter sp.]